MDDSILDQIERARRAQQKYEQRHDVQLEICGQLLYDDDSRIPTRRCIELFGIEHDHENASSISYEEWPNADYHADATKEDA